MKRPKRIAEKQIMIGSKQVTVQVIAPKELPEIPQIIASRDDSRSPAQQFMRQNRSKVYL